MYICIYQKYWGIKQLCIITLLQFKICLHIFTMDSTVKCRGGQKREHAGKFKHLNHCAKVFTTLLKCFVLKTLCSKTKHLWSIRQSFAQQFKCLNGLKHVQSEASLILLRIWALFWILTCKLAEQDSKRSPNAQKLKWRLWLKLFQTLDSLVWPLSTIGIAHMFIVFVLYRCAFAKTKSEFFKTIYILNGSIPQL